MRVKGSNNCSLSMCYCTSAVFSSKFGSIMGFSGSYFSGVNDVGFILVEDFYFSIASPNEILLVATASGDCYRFFYSGEGII